LSVTGPDRLKISLDIESNSGKSIPWQMEFEDNLTKGNSILKLQTHEDKQHFESPTIRFEEANKLFQEIVSAASKTSGFSINKPELITNNKNWIIGTNQNFKIYFDLREIPKIPGLKLNIVINDIGNKNNFRTKTQEPTFKQGLTFFPLEIGQINQLEISNWKWNQISIGLILIIALTLLSLSLQRLRLQMGFGFPELPP
jgi:DNA polymerase III delta subunit